MAQLDLDPVISDWLAPTWDGVRNAARALDGPDLFVTAGAVAGFWQVSDTQVVLSEALGGPDLHHPMDAQAAVPIDRWRRAAASVIEALALAWLRQVVEGDVDDWRAVGWAVWKAHQLFPELQVAMADLARVRRTGQLAADSRAGFAVYRALEREGGDPTTQARRWLAGESVDPMQFARSGRWALATDGGGAELPVPVPRPAAIDIPATLPPWSWVPLSVPPNPRGGHVRVEGPGVVVDPWGVHDQPLDTLAVALDGEVRLSGTPGGPVGRWTLRTAEGFGQVMGARGFIYEFATNGTLSLVLADAFVGPIAALDMAERVGTSGIVRGRWRVAGPATVRLSDLDTTPLTMHGHEDRFVLPAQGLGLAQAIQGMTSHPWVWRIEGDTLTLVGKVQGADVEARLERA